MLLNEFRSPDQNIADFIRTERLLACTSVFLLMFHQIMCQIFHEDNFVIADSLVAPKEHFFNPRWRNR